MSVAVVVLAAGASRRLGRPKQTVELGGRTLLARAVAVAVASGLGAVLVVVDPEDAAVVAEAERLACEVVRNGEAAEGMAASVRVGVMAVAGWAGGIVVMTCDQPAVSAAHLRALVEAGGGGEVAASQYAGRNGVPAYFPAAVFASLLELRGDVGARELLRGARAVELPHGELDLDTDGEIARAVELLRSGELR